MTKSALQIARAAYQPKLPKALKGAVKVQEGEPTRVYSISSRSGRNQEIVPEYLRHAVD